VGCIAWVCGRVNYMNIQINLEQLSRLHERCVRSHADHAVMQIMHSPFSTLTQPCVSSHCIKLMNCVIRTVSACFLCTCTFFVCVCQLLFSHITTQHMLSKTCATSPTPTLHQYACCETTDLHVRHVVHTSYTYAPHTEWSVMCTV
jgi:hypothetical protein